MIALPELFISLEIGNESLLILLLVVVEGLDEVILSMSCGGQFLLKFQVISPEFKEVGHHVRLSGLECTQLFVLILIRMFQILDLSLLSVDELLRFGLSCLVLDILGFKLGDSSSGILDLVLEGTLLPVSFVVIVLNVFGIEMDVFLLGGLSSDDVYNLGLVLALSCL